ncbi:DNA-3-methyladenine glycosylase I [Acholeplasma laidlawii]|uniref:DNA-3-methyladenine glycosylase I n=2 Tax=Acholeplasma laidlawii TaxID=2148 RepID=A9NEG4_ACHLI|nr:DNA-3-methyladenine glycosylase I [Acholeplasma laidlawii]ABX80744.1 DNA-3-methyladenine glycosylase I [Acholeplasma laidlawii PG-8A]NWH10696.1 DNA-3-methyladenine glycosylase I [Acholeplasma laidlawii]NWH12081.1 DNA-3-methyladenine glycosylase I [Acholeplasma laidlawii]NWH12510.1 DNA-3-methyladenine glycosylase I [Acholeplasma laidlawii]NWH14857.1 DNA-3-methyladenine glycosylase I [Acholeplasma laidlawii]
MSTLTRCHWANSTENMAHYHDHEWGVPLYDDLKLFQKLLLDMQQAGLSWSIVLNKRKDILEAFDNFDPYIMINYDEQKLNSLLTNPKIIRNRLKIEAMIHNAKMYIKHFGQINSFSDFLWSYVDHKVVVHDIKVPKDTPTETDISKLISRDLKRLGFKFVGSITIYAFLQAVGIYNDHQNDCFKKR